MEWDPRYPHVSYSHSSVSTDLFSVVMLLNRIVFCGTSAHHPYLAQLRTSRKISISAGQEAIGNDALSFLTLAKNVIENSCPPPGDDMVRGYVSELKSSLAFLLK